ncbi:MAG: methylated-DNA--[protein]-cysteine S-methyltransferase, partial [Sphingomonadales bacterium]|nr:methylated-DNA--[protein]-cysteine S-methyltransferase [Sphingomonadales bacterium]
VPCHRIVSAQGPEYYSGGNGVPTKAWLLAHEARHG